VTRADSLIDTLFDGRYRIVRKLGAGGMADVYLAEDQELGRRVAIKILDGRHANDAQFIERFRREAKNAAALNHPNIVSIYDRGEAEHTYYIAMEYLDGRTLKELIVGRGPAPVNVSVEYARQILSALRFAHRHGIVHRDIKPHNVLVDREGRVKVTDFGIARAGTSQMTEAGSIVGTAQYLSPEQARGTEVDQRSDLYSLGIVLYELLTGQTPFDGDTPVEIAMKHLSATPRPPSQIRRDVPRDLDMVVMRALAKDPSARYQSADEMEADLERVLRGATLAAATTDSATQIMSAPVGGAVADTAATMIAPHGAAAGYPGAVREVVVEEDERERPVWPWLVAALFVVAAAIAGVIVWHQLAGSPPQEPVGQYNNCEPVKQAKRQIEAVHLHWYVKHQATTQCKAGEVFKQDPTGGTLPKGDAVTIWVSTGKPKVKMPKLAGQMWIDAKKELIKLGLKPTRRIVPGKTKNIVTATDPGAGQEATVGSTVIVNVAAGPVIKTVPNVVNESEQQAQSDLAASGFNLVVAGYVDSDKPQNYVVSQDPQPGKNLAQGSSVKVKLSNGPPLKTVPDVFGETSAQATHDLKAAGFKVVVNHVAVSDPSQNDLVQSQTPAGNAQAPEHSTVTITVGQYTATTTTTTTTPGPP
jgi:eukaryotic-like serine/threonine-protein kinase